MHIFNCENTSWVFKSPLYTLEFSYKLGHCLKFNTRQRFKGAEFLNSPKNFIFRWQDDAKCCNFLQSEASKGFVLCLSKVHFWGVQFLYMFTTFVRDSGDPGLVSSQVLPEFSGFEMSVCLFGPSHRPSMGHRMPSHPESLEDVGFA